VTSTLARTIKDYIQMDGPKNWHCKILLLGFLLALSACTQAAFTAANLPTHLVEMAVEHDRA
jgi:hypothetical protein